MNSVVDWDSKPYPWNELGKEWVEICRKGFAEPSQPRQTQEGTEELADQPAE